MKPRIVGVYIEGRILWHAKGDDLHLCTVEAAIKMAIWWDKFITTEGF